MQFAINSHKKILKSIAFEGSIVYINCEFIHNVIK